MLYWLSVYVLIAIAVAVPLLALYVLGIVLWLIITAIRLMIRSLKDALAVRPDFSRAHWSVIRRKVA